MIPILEARIESKIVLIVGARVASYIVPLQGAFYAIHVCWDYVFHGVHLIATLILLLRRTRRRKVPSAWKIRVVILAIAIGFTAARGGTRRTVQHVLIEAILPSLLGRKALIKFSVAQTEFVVAPMVS